MRRTLLALAAALVACVPADEALPTGSVEFTIFAREPETFFSAGAFVDRFVTSRRSWDVRIDRVLLSLKTMTIGSIENPDQCSYRGRGARSNVVFEPERGNVQTFNGIMPGPCPDVGIVLGPPDARTFLARGVTPADYAALVASPASHVIVAATATPASTDVEARAYRLFLRFDAERSSTTYGGCRVAQKGVVVQAEARAQETVAFSARALFRDAFTTFANLRFQPFADADDDGNADGIITMDELDAVRLATVRATYSSGYVLPDGRLAGTFGDYVRSQLRFTFEYGDGGLCTGNPPGVE